MKSEKMQFLKCIPIIKKTHLYKCSHIYGGSSIVKIVEFFGYDQLVVLYLF
jgi:hypothetical protein